jgi:MFS family permease
MVAVFHRQSLGVTEIDAATRFGIGAAALSTLAMLQLLVYAAMQVPVGILLDRWGSKRMLLAGAAVMSLGQLLFAGSTNLPEAVAGRVLVGCGDAMTFISVIRLVNVWLPSHRNPLFVQLTGFMGQVGAIVSAVPLITSLHTFGWRPTFLGAAALGVMAVVVVAVGARDRVPERGTAVPGVRAAWAEPGTRLGMWTHAATQSSAAAFTLLWGYPFLVQDEGLSPETSGVLLTALTICSMVFGPLIGYLAGRFPRQRSSMVLAVIGMTAGGWALVLLWPGRAPMWTLVLLVLALGTNGPASAIGFDFARTFNPAQRLGVAAGIVNGGGFVASMSVIALIGIATDLMGDFHWAYAAQFPVLILGAVQVVRYRTRARRVGALHLAPTSA